MAVDESLVPIDEFDGISTEDKMVLKTAHRLCEAEYGDTTGSYTGVLLHGAQGAGKTTLVKSWCRYIKGTLITINSTAQGPLRGQPERLVTLLFEKAAAIGENELVVIILDKAEQVLGATSSDQDRNVRSLIRECISDVQSKNAEVYLFAVTTTPEDIDLGNDWNRRLAEKIHLQLPGQAGREAMVKKAFGARRAILSSREVTKIAEKLTGFSASDIHALAAFGGHAGDVLELITGWKEHNCGGKLVLKPAELGDEVDVTGQFDQLTKANRRRVRLPAAEAGDIMKWIEQCRKRGLPTVEQGELDKHQRYADRFRRT